MQDLKTQYWFPAKRYGWGWGAPSRREGWIVLIAWLAITVGGSIYLARHFLPWFFVFIAVMVIALVAVCWAKGEPPRWRWGE